MPQHPENHKAKAEEEATKKRPAGLQSLSLEGLCDHV